MSGLWMAFGCLVGQTFVGGLYLLKTDKGPVGRSFYVASLAIAGFSAWSVWQVLP